MPVPPAGTANAAVTAMAPSTLDHGRGRARPAMEMQTAGANAAGETAAATAWAALPPMSAMWKTKVLEDAGGDLLQFKGINRRGTAAVFPFTYAAMPTCDNRDNRMFQARFSSTSNNFREPVGDPWF